MDWDKIKLIGLTNVDLPIVNVDPLASYVLKEIIGLGPPDIEVSIMQDVNSYGIYQNSFPQGREIVVRIRLNPDYENGETVSDLRTVLYGILSPGATKEEGPAIEIWSGVSKIAVAYARIKRFETAIFSKEPEVQITYACFSPYLSQESATMVNTGSLSKASPEINNPGNAPSGFRMGLTFTANKSSFTLTATDGAKKIQITYAFLTNDLLTIDTQPGSRTVEVTRSGVTTNLLGSLSNDSTWLELIGGVNHFTTSSQDFDWSGVNFTPQYWGV